MIFDLKKDLVTTKNLLKKMNYLKYQQTNRCLLVLGTAEILIVESAGEINLHCTRLFLEVDELQLRCVLGSQRDAEIFLSNVVE